jgi:hypothetical protein
MNESLREWIYILGLGLLIGVLLFFAYKGKKLISENRTYDIEQVMREVHESLSKDGLARASQLDDFSKQLKEIHLFLQKKEDERQVEKETLAELKSLANKIIGQAGKPSERSKKNSSLTAESYADGMKSLQQQMDTLSNSWEQSSLTLIEQIKGALQNIEKQISELADERQMEKRTRDQWFNVLVSLRESLDYIRASKGVADADKIIQTIELQGSSLISDLDRQLVTLKQILVARGYKDCPSCGNVAVTNDALYCFECGYRFDEKITS